MSQVARRQPIVKRENSDEDPEPTPPTSSHVARGNPRVKREDSDEEPEPRRVTRSQSARRTPRVKREDSDDESESSHTTVSNTQQGPRRSPRAKLNKKVGLRLYTAEQSKLAKETHHVVVEEPPVYDSDINMVREPFFAFARWTRTATRWRLMTQGCTDRTTTTGRFSGCPQVTKKKRISRYSWCPVFACEKLA